MAGLAARLLRDVWVVESIDALPGGFAGVAVTRAGRSSTPKRRALAGAGGRGRAPARGARPARRAGAASERAAAAEIDARTAPRARHSTVAEADSAARAPRAPTRGAPSAAEAAELANRAEWLIARRRGAPDDGPEAVRRAELNGDLRAEQRLAERIEREREERAGALRALRSGAERDLSLAARAGRAAAALEAARDAVAARRDRLAAELESDAAAGEQTAAALKACAREEAELQGRLRRASEAVTQAEVAAQQVRDSAADADRELRALGAGSASSRSPPPRRSPGRSASRCSPASSGLRAGAEQLGPVNPLAAREYEEAVAHVEELETQRADLETRSRSSRG